MSVDASRAATDGRTGPLEPPGGARAWLVWGVGVGVYFLAMFHRNGMSVAALEAQERFQVGPALLSLLPMLQLLVYVVLQVPTGLLADRIGPRRSLLMGLVSMALGVGLFAVAPSIELAVLGRVLIGLGDAVTFLNVIRLGALWFPRSRYALVSALTGVVGGLGQVASVTPLSLALEGVGWTASFLGAGVVTVLMMLLVLFAVRDRADGVSTAAPAERLSVWASVGEALRSPGPRVGMAHHAAVMAPYTTLTVLWGYAFLVEGVGMSSATAGLLLSGLGVATLWLSPVLGAFVGRSPGARRPFAMLLGGMLSLGWLALTLWPGGPPTPLVVAVLTVSAAGAVIAPALSFDFARDGVPAHRTGAASGLVNMSGFTTTVIATVSAGVILEALPEPHDVVAFQKAFLPLTGTTVLATLVLIALLWRYPARR
ncbi:MFS transporter [Marinactinospora thermotolerans]|uniref:Sugar phosphate permease n=1 Tax=Marinactinospora thermotolerans DSM 45154 TaxID=1122192 RepID=A0A1T4NAC4_9ACTN|nr:MFS transporter [Marinactinospora thermotolerans]SJZ76027.1 Sugar phosphate permease [Marinactinospora thermotolerans DSM 45154]